MVCLRGETDVVSVRKPVNRVPDADEVNALLSLFGPTTYSLKSWRGPALPATKLLAELTQLQRDRLEPKPPIIAERTRFYCRAQEEGEPIVQFVAAFRKLNQTCELRTFLDESMRDRFVFGLRCVDIQRALFAEAKTLTFQKAVDRAAALDSALKSASAMHGSSASGMQGENAGTYKSQSHKEDLQTPVETYYRCGSTKHISSACSKSGAVCLQCKKVGPILRVCRFLRGNETPRRKKELLMSFKWKREQKTLP